MNPRIHFLLKEKNNNDHSLDLYEGSLLVEHKNCVKSKFYKIQNTFYSIQNIFKTKYIPYKFYKIQNTSYIYVFMLLYLAGSLCYLRTKQCLFWPRSRSSTYLNVLNTERQIALKFNIFRLYVNKHLCGTYWL